jgi:GT2 family glycosyltransferase
MPRVSAAVLNFNGRALLEVVVPSLVVQTYRDFEAIVIDDCSTDDSVAYLRRDWPQVRVVSTGPVNVGVAAALNIAVSASSGEFVALLNNDIELDKRWLEELVVALDAHPEAATGAGKLLNYHRRELIDGCGDIFTRGGMAWGRGAGQLDSGQYDRHEEVFAPTAGAGLYRAAALARVGPFDESFYAYFEDVDWGWRAQLAGYRCRYVPTAIAYHMGSMTTQGDRDRLFYQLQRRNNLAVLVKDAPARLLLRNAHLILGNQLLGLAYSARAGMLWTHFRALASAARALPEWLRARRRIMGGSQIASDEFERFISASRR